MAPHKKIETKRALSSRMFWMLCLMTVISVSSYVTLVMAVDRSKFRTCAQTSFCRRHRGGHSKGLYQYKLVKDTIQFQVPGTVPTEPQNNIPKVEKETLFKSFKSRILGSNSETGDSEGDPYVKGPEPTFTATLVNVAESTSTGDKDESLALSIHLHKDGVARVRITEEYGKPGTKYQKARWTSDELVLNLEEMVPATNVRMVDGADPGLAEDDQANLSTIVEKIDSTGNFAQDNFVFFQYGDDDSSNQSASCLLLVQLEPFSIYLWRGDNTHGPPIVTINTENLMHFEIRRTKEEQQQQEEHIAKTLPDDVDKEDTLDENSDRHGGKEIVGYWEDGLAIYADGSREERPEEDTDDAEHRRLLEEQAPELDKEGMWEEDFQTHHDSKPFGPMSVGADVIFPQSNHLFGLPEHASSTQLKTTHGEGADYTEPYRLYNLDVFEYELDETMALYGEVPFIISQSKVTGSVGVFYFNPTESFVDVEIMPDNNGSKTHWMSESGVMDIFILPGPDPKSLYGQYAKLTGRMPLPPMFSLGYHQCRWNYRDEKDVYDVHSNFEELDYPYDVLWLDIEHTDGKRYFTWDSNAFPNPKQMQEKLSSQGRNMVTIVDPHIMRDNAYYVHKEATAKSLYIKDKTGKADYDGWCWPGSSSYLDFTNEQVRSWWADQFSYDKYEGSTPSLFTWNDMNEPSVFNGPEVSMQKDLLNLAGVEHREWHNLYGMLFQRATSEGLIRRNQPDENERPFVLSRSFFAGSQKYGAIWTGDNGAEWSHLEIAAPMLLSLNTAALSFVGADVGGFFGDPDAELVTRWMQAGAYQPFFRGHAHHDSKRREPWLFGDEWMSRMRIAAMKRYALLPYWYTVFRVAGITGMPVMRTMWMQYPEAESLYSLDDQYLIGSDLLVKPITSPDAQQVKVEFPAKDNWYDVDTLKEMVTETSGEATSLNLKCNLDKMPAYQRGGSVLARKLRLRRSSRLMYSDPYTLYVALDRSGLATGDLYMDDEHSFDHMKLNQFGSAKFSVDMKSFVHNIVSNGGSDWATNDAPNRMIERIIIMGAKNAPTKLLLGQTSIDFNYDESSQVLVIRKPNVSALKDWEIEIQH